MHLIEPFVPQSKFVLLNHFQRFCHTEFRTNGFPSELVLVTVNVNSVMNEVICCSGHENGGRIVEYEIHASRYDIQQMWSFIEDFYDTTLGM